MAQVIGCVFAGSLALFADTDWPRAREIRHSFKHMLDAMLGISHAKLAMELRGDGCA